jgi:hypothetical protein
LSPKSDERGGAYADRVRAQSECLANVCSAADTARDNQLHPPLHPEFLQRLHGRRDRGEGLQTDILDEHRLGRGGAPLHAVQYRDVGTASAVS